MPRTTRSRASMLAQANEDLKKEPSPSPRSRKVKQEPNEEKHVHFPPDEKDDSNEQKQTPNTSRKRKRDNVPKDEVTKLKHEKEVKAEADAEHEEAETSTPSPKRKAKANASPKSSTKTKSSPKNTSTPTKSPKSNGKTKGSKAPSEKDLSAGADLAQNLSSETTSSPKKNTYGLTPNTSPYPTYPHPTPQECEEVNRILQKAHGKVSAPTSIPTPSLSSSGCGEVPSVLDALIRTRLSAATNNANSSRAFRGLVEKFGVLKEGIGKGSVNWDAVRQASQKDVFTAIQSGGLADVKSRDIKNILEMVWQENQARRDELEAGKKGEEQETKEEGAEEKDREVARVKEGVLSLDHLHLLDNDAAFQKLIGYPGIGPKTASCVLLFCMQRPSFAVDTHVFRLTKWLGWVPSDQQARGMAKQRAKEEGNKRVSGGQVTREMTYAHLDVKIPDHLKYPLHYLLIRHGRNCGWCSAKAGKDAKKGVCPLAHLMKGKGRNKGLAKKGDIDENDSEGDSDDDESKMHGMEVDGEEKSEEED